MKKEILKIIEYPNEILRKKTREVKASELKDPKTVRLILSMIETMKEAKGVGLAAPQVASNLRICVLDVNGEILALINPKIKSYSRKKDVFEEGCLSFPGKFFEVERPISIKMQAQNTQGEKIKMKADGFFARALQHEIDHLDGILIIDRAVKN